MRARFRFPLDVSPPFTRWIVREDRPAASRIKNARIERIPRVLIAAVAVHHHHRRNLPGARFGQVQDGREAHAELCCIADALGDHAFGGFETAVCPRC